MPASIRVRIKTTQFPQGRWLQIPPSATVVRDVFYLIVSNSTFIDDTKEGQELLLQGSQLLMDDHITIIRDGDTLELRSCPTGTARQSESGNEHEENTRSSPDNSFFKFNAIASDKSIARSTHSFSEHATNKICPEDSIPGLPSPQKPINQTLGRKSTPVISANLTYLRVSATHQNSASAPIDFSAGQVEQSSTVLRRYHSVTQEHPFTKEPFTSPLDSKEKPGHFEVLEKNPMKSTVSSHEVETTKDRCMAREKKSFHEICGSSTAMREHSSDPTSLLKSQRVCLELRSEQYLDQDSQQVKPGPRLSSELLMKETNFIDNETPSTSEMDTPMQQVRLGEKPSQSHFQPESNEITDCKQFGRAKEREAKTVLDKRSDKSIRTAPDDSPLEAIIGLHVRASFGKPPGIRKKRIRTLSVEAKRKRNARNRRREQRKRKALRQLPADCGMAEKPSVLLPRRTSERCGPDPEFSFDRNKKECAIHNERDGIFAEKRVGISTKMPKDPLENIRGKRQASNVENAQCVLEVEKAKLLDEIQVHKEPQALIDEQGGVMLSEQTLKDTLHDRAKSKVIRHNSVASALRLARANGMLDIGSDVNLSGNAEVHSQLPGVKPGTQCNPCPSHRTRSPSAFTGKQTKKSRRKRANLSKKATAYIEEEQYNESFFIGFESSERMALPTLDLLDMFRPEDQSDDVKVRVTAYDKNCPVESSRMNTSPGTISKEVPRVAPKSFFEQAKKFEESQVRNDVTGNIMNPQLDLHHLSKNNRNTDKRASTTKLSLQSADQTTGELESFRKEKCTNSGVSKTIPPAATCDSLVAGIKVVSAEGSYTRDHASSLSTKQAYRMWPKPSPFSQRFNRDDKSQGKCSKLIAGAYVMKQITCETDSQIDPGVKSSQPTPFSRQNDLPSLKPISPRQSSDKEVISNARECVTKRQRSRLLPVDDVDNGYPGCMQVGKSRRTTRQGKPMGDTAEKTIHQLRYKENGSKRRKSHGGSMECGIQFVVDQLPEKQYIESQKCFITKDLSTGGRSVDMPSETDTQLTVATGGTRPDSNADGYLDASFRGSLLHVLQNSIDVVGKFCSGRFK